MDTDLVTQFHRIEGKLNALLQYFIFQHGMPVPDALNEERICMGCGSKFTWLPSSKGYPITKCDCELPISAVDYTSYSPPVLKEKK